MGSFRKGKIGIIAKFYRTNLVIRNHSRGTKNLSYSRTNTVTCHHKHVGPRPWFDVILNSGGVGSPTWPQGYKTFFVLNSIEQEILNAHKYKNIVELHWLEHLWDHEN